jgi:hypothetical protein
MKTFLLLHAIAEAMAGKIEYQGTVYLYNTGYTDEVVKRGKSRLAEYGVNPADIRVIDKPEGIPDGSIMVTLWAHNLEVSKVRIARSGSIISTNLLSIEL